MADLLLREAETRCDLFAIDVQPLRRDVDIDTAFAVRNGEAGLGPEERLILGADVVGPLDHDIGLRIGIAVHDAHRANHVRTGIVQIVAVRVRPGIRMQRLRLGSALRVGDRDERLVVDDDQRSSTPCLFRMLRGDERNRLSEVADAVDREHGLVEELEPVRLATRDVGVREHRVHACDAECARQVDRSHPRVRVRAAKRVAPEHPGRLQIARVRELAGGLRHAVDAAQAFADVAEHHLVSRHDA